MGRVVTLSEVHLSPAAGGVATGPVTKGDLKEFSADLVEVSPGRSWLTTTKADADTYLFTLSGEGTITAGDRAHTHTHTQTQTQTHVLAPQTFATLAGHTRATVEAEAASPLRLLRVTTPLAARADVPGFTGTLSVLRRAECPIVPIPADHKQRIYFCGHHGGAATERGHGMIVVYDGETHTALHHHPDAESMFVLIDGACEFTVEGRTEIVAPGQAVYFRANDSHGLRTAPGHQGASFLEFHIPAKFSTVKE